MFYNYLLSCLSCQNHFMFLNHGYWIACRCNRFPSWRRRLFLFDTSSHKVFREENHPFRKNAWTFMKFIPGLHTTWHMCVFYGQYTLNKWRTTHNTLCGYYKFSFRISHWNKFYCDFKYYFVQYFYTSCEKIFGYEYRIQ